MAGVMAMEGSWLWSSWRKYHFLLEGCRLYWSCGELDEAKGPRGVSSGAGWWLVGSCGRARLGVWCGCVRPLGSRHLRCCFAQSPSSLPPPFSSRFPSRFLLLFLSVAILAQAILAQDEVAEEQLRRRHLT